MATKRSVCCNQHITGMCQVLRVPVLHTGYVLRLQTLQSSADNVLHDAVKLSIADGFSACDFGQLCSLCA